jgi:molybdenum cofactor cytidylyltransferase
MIRALILGAGESKRMGKPKLLLPYQQSTIIETVVQTAVTSDVDAVTVVLGANAGRIAEKIVHQNVSIVVNKAYRDGMFSSIQCGLRQLPSDTSAIVLMLGDQPGIPATVINAIIAAWKESGMKIILPLYESRKGHPILIDMSFRDELLSSGLKEGMRSFMKQNEMNILELPVSSSAILDDIDTPQDYEMQANRDLNP